MEWKRQEKALVRTYMLFYRSLKHSRPNWWRHKSGHAENISYQLAICQCFYYIRIWWKI